MGYPYMVMMAALAAALLSILWRGQFSKRPALFLFLGTLLTMSIRMRGIDPSSLPYIDLYCESEVFVGLAELLLGRELYRLTLQRYPGLGWVGRAFGAMALATALVAAMGAIEPAMRVDWKLGAMQAAFLWRIGVSVAMAVFAALLAFGSRTLRNQFSRNYLIYRGMVIGFGFTTAAMYLCSLWRVLSPLVVYYAMLAATVALSLSVVGMTRAGEVVPAHQSRLSAEEIADKRSRLRWLANALRWKSASLAAERLRASL